MIAFPSENLSAFDWTSDQWPVQFVRGIDVILLKLSNLYSTEVQSLLLYRQSSPVTQQKSEDSYNLILQYEEV